MAPMVAGTFAVYEDGTGGYVLVTQVEGRPVEHRRIPAAMVKMSMRLFGQLSRRQVEPSGPDDREVTGDAVVHGP